MRLLGLVVVEPSVRALSDGEVVTGWRLAIERPPERRRPLVGSDTVTCATSDPAVRGVATSFRLGDTVEVSGGLRRRAWRTTTGVVNFYEVEVYKARLVSSALPLDGRQALQDERPDGSDDEQPDAT
ncbi:MAG: single-stranded DNA-binding protein [Streptosporangiales bacterium]|nr:single-stranded DNA-binding protein [Streptosporangiales bacterium]